MSQPKPILLYVPDIGETKSIELLSWNVEEGMQVQKGQELCELVTDKAAFPLEAPEDGKVIKIHKLGGQNVKIGDALVEFLTLS